MTVCRPVRGGSRHQLGLISASSTTWATSPILAVVTRIATHIVVALIVAIAASCWLRGGSPCSSLSSFSFTSTAQTRLEVLISRVVSQAHISVCSATTNRVVGPSASTSTALWAVMIITSGHAGLLEIVGLGVECLDKKEAAVALEV